MAFYNRKPTGAFDCGFRIGDQVHLVDDPVHIGRVDAVISAVIKIVWNDSGWIEYQPNASNLVLYKRVAEVVLVSEPGGVATVTKSPKRELQEWLSGHGDEAEANAAPKRRRR